MKTRAGSTRVGVSLVVAILVLIVAVPAAGAKAKVPRCHVIDATSPRTFGTLQAAIDAAAPGTTLRVKGTCLGSSTVTKSMTIAGHSNPAFGPATLDGGGVGRVLTIHAGVSATVTGITITNGTSPVGGGVFNDGVLTLVRSVVTANTAQRGGGIANVEAGRTLTLRDSTVSGNSATDLGGGILNVDGDTTLLGTTRITANQATVGGGILASAHGSMTIRGVTSIDHNVAMTGGGMSCGDCDQTSLNDASTVHDNVALGSGGGIAVGGFGRIRLNGSSSVFGNTAAVNGGGVWFSQFAGTSILLDGSSSIHDNHPDNCFPPDLVPGCPT